MRTSQEGHFFSVNHSVFGSRLEKESFIRNLKAVDEVIFVKLVCLSVVVGHKSPATRANVPSNQIGDVFV